MEVADLPSESISVVNEAEEASSFSENAPHLQNIIDVYGKVQLTGRKITGTLHRNRPQTISVKVALGPFHMIGPTQSDPPFTSMERQM